MSYESQLSIERIAKLQELITKMTLELPPSVISVKLMVEYDDGQIAIADGKVENERNQDEPND